jgi:hypothetical protein
MGVHAQQLGRSQLPEEGCVHIAVICQLVMISTAALHSALGMPWVLEGGIDGN